MNILVEQRLRLLLEMTYLSKPMKAEPTLLFKIAFAIVTFLEILGDVTHTEWLHYVCKPLIMASLLLYVWQNYRHITYARPIDWLIVGMVFALAGDVFLMIQEVDLFAPGLGAFLVMQVCYCVAFVKSMHQTDRKIRLQTRGINALPFLIYVIGFLVVLRPVFAHNPALSTLWWPVVVYAVCLGTMGLLTTYRQGLPDRNQVVTGALLFIFSDSVIAINKFLIPIVDAPGLIMTTYAAAQYLIVTGMTRAALSPKESIVTTSLKPE